MEPVTTTAAAKLLGESADALKATLEAVPTGGQKRAWHRERRLRAYLGFQRAAIEASTWPVWLGVLEQAILAKEVTTAQAMPDLSASRSAISALLAALSEIRLIGNPEPRKLAEEITTLLAELMEARVRGTLPRTIRAELAERAGKWSIRALETNPDIAARIERIPGMSDRVERVRAFSDQEAQEAKAAWFSDCQMALGAWHKKFTLAARKDLGYGSRWWHFGKKPRAGWWQLWRPHDEWPGGWPPPDADQLVSQARMQREETSAAQSESVPALNEGPDSAAVTSKGLQPARTNDRLPSS